MLPIDKHLVRLADQLDIDSCKKLVIHLGIQEHHLIDLIRKYDGDALTINTMALHTWMKTKIKGKSSTKSLQDLLEGLEAIGAKRHLLCKVCAFYNLFQMC